MAVLTESKVAHYRYLGNRKYTEIPEDATEVIIEDDITVIPTELFRNNKKLQYVEIGNSVTHIMDYAFENCSSLYGVHFGGNVKYIGDYAFSHCKNFWNCDFPDSLVDIGEYAFEYCEGLEKIFIPNKVQYIGSGAFSNCSSLEDVRFSKHQPEIDPTAFIGTPYDGLFSNRVELTPHNVYAYKDEILDFIKSNYSELINKSYSRGHILPDGTFLTNTYSGTYYDPHRVIDAYVCQGLVRQLGWSVKGFDFDGSLGNSLFDLLDCIRVNGDKEDYIAIPYGKPTRQQMDTLEKWLDWFFYVEDVGEIRVTTMFGAQVTYHRAEYEPEEIVQKINRYYNTGNLYENKKKKVNNGMKRYFENSSQVTYAQARQIQKWDEEIRNYGGDEGIIMYWLTYGVEDHYNDWTLDDYMDYDVDDYYEFKEVYNDCKEMIREEENGTRYYYD